MSKVRSRPCYLGIGSNLGDRRATLEWAAARLFEVFTTARLSPFYETAPLDYEAQPYFRNAVVEGVWRGTPEKLLDMVLEIERRAGRNRDREVRKGPRRLDIDILLLGDEVVHTSRLVIPHPRLAVRAFALKPLLDLVPEITEPGTGRPYRAFLEELPDQGIYLDSEHPYTLSGGRS